MKQPKQNEMLAAALRRAAPVINQLRAEPEPVPSAVLQRLRRALDAPCPEPPQQLDEPLTAGLLTLLVEEPKDISDLVTGLRSLSIRCNETHVGRWVETLCGVGLVTRNLVAESEGRNEVFELTTYGYACIGRIGPVVMKAKVEQMLMRDD